MGQAGKEYALSLGFSESDAEMMALVNASNENIDRIAVIKGYIVDVKAEAVKAAAEKAVRAKMDELAAAEDENWKCPLPDCGVIHNPESRIGKNHAEQWARAQAKLAIKVAEEAVTSVEDSDGSEGASETDIVPEGSESGIGTESNPD